jgi:hypothetical protein
MYKKFAVNNTFKELFFYCCAATGKPSFFIKQILVAAMTGCVAAKQNPFQKKRAKASKVNTSQLGRNRYYFSTGYQKKLVRSHKKK